MPTLVLIRHGQSAWNLENRFTGWWDVDLTAKGEEPKRSAAGELMVGQGTSTSTCVSPRLQTRAIKHAVYRARAAMGRLWLPVEKDWRLNERHYGGLTGLEQGGDRGAARRRSGPCLAAQLRHSARRRWTPADRIRSVRRTAAMPASPSPSTESLKDTIDAGAAILE